MSKNMRNFFISLTGRDDALYTLPQIPFRCVVLCLSIHLLSGCVTTVYQQDGKTPLARVPWSQQVDITAQGTHLIVGPGPRTVDAVTTVALAALPLVGEAAGRIGEKLADKMQAGQ